MEPNPGNWFWWARTACKSATSIRVVMLVCFVVMGKDATRKCVHYRINRLPIANTLPMLPAYNGHMLRILIASPYPAMRAGLHALLEEADAGRAAMTVVGEADSVETCLDWSRAAQPQVVLFDLALDPDDELSGLWRLRTQIPSVAVLALSESNGDARMLAALQAGARGCLPKTATGAELLEAAQGVVEGETVLPPAATAALLEQLRGGGVSLQVLLPVDDYRRHGVRA